MFVANHFVKTKHGVSKQKSITTTKEQPLYDIDQLILELLVVVLLFE